MSEFKNIKWYNPFKPYYKPKNGFCSIDDQNIKEKIPLRYILKNDLKYIWKKSHKNAGIIKLII